MHDFQLGKCDLIGCYVLDVVGRVLEFPVSAVIYIFSFKLWNFGIYTRLIADYF